MKFSICNGKSIYNHFSFSVLGIFGIYNESKLFHFSKTDDCAMIIPSVLTSTEMNVLINPGKLKPDSINEPFSYVFDQRLTTASYDRSDGNEDETKKKVRLLRLLWIR